MPCELVLRFIACWAQCSSCVHCVVSVGRNATQWYTALVGHNAHQNNKNIPTALVGRSALQIKLLLTQNMYTLVGPCLYAPHWHVIICCNGLAQCHSNLYIMLTLNMSLCNDWALWPECFFFYHIMCRSGLSSERNAHTMHIADILFKHRWYFNVYALINTICACSYMFVWKLSSGFSWSSIQLSCEHSICTPSCLLGLMSPA